MSWIDWSKWAEEPLIIQVHAIIAVLGFVVGGFVMLRAKGTRGHRWAGRVFAVLALATAGTSFFIHEIRVLGPFSPIHVLSVLTIVLVWRGVVAIRAGRIGAHQRFMRLAYLSGFIVAGAFTFLEGRLNYEIFVERGLEAALGNEIWPARLMLAAAIFVTLVSIGLFLRGNRRAQAWASRPKSAK